MTLLRSQMYNNNTLTFADQAMIKSAWKYVKGNLCHEIFHGFEKIFVSEKEYEEKYGVKPLQGDAVLRMKQVMFELSKKRSENADFRRGSIFLGLIHAGIYEGEGENRKRVDRIDTAILKELFEFDPYEDLYEISK